MLKTVYFDLGNVLVFFSLPKMLEQMGKCTGLSSEDVKHLLFNTNLRELYEKGVIHTDDLFKAFQNRSSKPFTLEEFTHSFCNIFTPNLDLWKVVEKLKKQNIRLILLSNTSECHYNYSAANFPVLNLFDHKVLSYEVGAWKPDEQIFKKALEHAQCDPADCFYTDDIPEFIESARRIGLKGEVYTGVDKLKKDLSKLGLQL